MYVTELGAVDITNVHMATHSSRILCPPNAELKLEIESGTVDTNPVYGVVEIEEVPSPMRRRRGGRGYGRRRFFRRKGR